MAHIRTVNGKIRSIDRDKAYGIWRVLSGEEQGTEEQQAFCETVAEIYLNYKDPDCPKSYLAQRATIHRKMEYQPKLPNFKKEESWEEKHLLND